VIVLPESLEVKPLSDYITRLENIVNPLAKAMMNNLKFYRIEESDVLATFMSTAQLSELVYEYEINYPWDFGGFVEWANKIKGYLVFKIDIIPFAPVQ